MNWPQFDSIIRRDCQLADDTFYNILNSKQMKTLNQKLDLPFTPSNLLQNFNKTDSFDRINTHFSTQVTAREQTNRNNNQYHSHLHNVKNHITLMESFDSGRQVGKNEVRRNSSGQMNKQQRQNQYYKNGPQEMGRSKSQRRRKIFDNKHKSLSKNQNSHRNPIFAENYKANVSSQYIAPNFQQNPLQGVRFIETIPVVQKRLIKTNSLTRLNHQQIPNKSQSKITFTYTTEPPIFHHPQHLIVPHKQTQIFFRSTTQPVLNIKTQQNSHENPVNIKIKKPKPTNIKEENTKNKESPSKIASNVSLKNNFCQSLIRGYSLATDKNLHDESFSNIQQRSSNRYYDDQGEEDRLLAEKISYKNIDIHSENIGEHQQEIHAENIFQDFERRKNQHQNSIRQSIRNSQTSKKVNGHQPFQKNKLQVPKEQTSKNNNSNILEKSYFAIEAQIDKNESKMLFPVFLVAFAFLLLLIQLSS